MLDRNQSMNGMTEIGEYQEEQQISSHPVYSKLTSGLQKCALISSQVTCCTLGQMSTFYLRIDPGSQKLSVTSNLDKYVFASLSDMRFEKKLKERVNRDIFDLQRFHFWHLNPKRCEILTHCPLEICTFFT